MKRVVWLIPLSFILYACPFESTVPLEAHPVEAVDSSYYGYWYGIVKDGSDFFGIEALDITRASDSTYAIIRYGKSAKGDIILPDTAHFTGYISYLEGQRYMNIESSVVTLVTRKKKAPVLTTSKVYYMALFEMRHDTLTVKAVSEDFSPIRKVFHSTAELKQAIIELTSQKKDIYDDLYTLSYRKIPRPQPLKPL